MKSRLAVVSLVIAAIVLLAAAAVQLVPAPRTLVLIRHAERADASPDSLLSPAGEARAARLAQVLAGLGVRTIYVSEYQRTRQTAQPLAQQLGLTPVVVAAKDSAVLLHKLRSGPSRDAALVVGHSDTLPALLKKLGVVEPVQIQHDQFHDLYIVVTHRFGRPTLLQLRY